jgi:DNA primase
VRGLIDALTFWTHGFKNVTTAYGVEGFTEEILEALALAKVERVLIAFDRDEAGERGAAKAAERLMARGIECRRVLFPHNQDANEYARKVQPADKALSVLLNAAVWMGKGRALPAAASSHASAPAPSSLEVAAKCLAAPAPVPEPVTPTMPNEAAKEKAPVPKSTGSADAPGARRALDFNPRRPRIPCGRSRKDARERRAQSLVALKVRLGRRGRRPASTWTRSTSRAGRGPAPLHRASGRGNGPARGPP